MAPDVTITHTGGTYTVAGAVFPRDETGLILTQHGFTHNPATGTYTATTTQAVARGAAAQLRDLGLTVHVN
jgi:hypothetical protein